MSRPIEDNGLIGSVVSCALLGCDGSIDGPAVPVRIGRVVRIDGERK